MPLPPPPTRAHRLPPTCLVLACFSPVLNDARARHLGRCSPRRPSFLHLPVSRRNVVPLHSLLPGAHRLALSPSLSFPPPARLWTRRPPPHVVNLQHAGAKSGAKGGPRRRSPRTDARRPSVRGCKQKHSALQHGSGPPSWLRRPRVCVWAKGRANERKGVVHPRVRVRTHLWRKDADDGLASVLLTLSILLWLWLAGWLAELQS